MAPKVTPLAPFAGFPKPGVSWFQSLAVAQNREWLLLKNKALGLSRKDIPKNVRFTRAFQGWVLEQAKLAAPVIKWGLTQKL